MEIVSNINNVLASINKWMSDTNDNIWIIALAFVLAAGILFLIKFRAMQIVTINEQVKLIRRTSSEKIEEAGEDKISSFQAFCVGMGARVGVGSIAGVASAIMFGGAGAVLWMWIFAIIGGATSFVESTLGQIFKEKKSDGNFHGGPAYYIKNGLKSHRFSTFIAFWSVVTFGFGFIAIQTANTCDMFVESLITFEGADIVIGVIFTALTALLVFGGIGRISRASEVMVPIMIVLWFVTAIFAIIINFDKLGYVINLMFTDAFNISKISSGFIGSCVMWGVKRSLFTNEAGLGSIPNVASSANVSHPICQGLVQSISVLITTIIVCGLTAFMLLTCLPKAEWAGIWGIKGANTTPMKVVQDAMQTAYGGEWILWILGIIVFVFAFSTLVGCYNMAEVNLRFLKDDDKIVTIFRIIVTANVFVTCIVPVSMVWNLCDMFMAISAVLNIVAITLLSKYVLAAFKDYFRQKKAGVDEPIFDIDNWDDGRELDKSGILSWSRK
ncbi:MAG: alanine:cation symporter family protein [archaeon]|nr:alanine:cation symporter family protein [archaeon]